MKKKIIYWIMAIILVLISGFIFLFYGPITSFKETFITTAMTTMNHRFLAELLYSNDYIYKVLEKNKIDEGEEVSDKSLIKITKGKNERARNVYDKEILDRDKNNDLYKIINIKGKGYHGYLVAIYDPSKISLGVTKYLKEKGEKITTVAKREKAVLAINAGGFYDPTWDGNGSTPHGTVIKNKKIISEYESATVGGGFIGFDNDDKLILGKFSKEEALKQNYRDAIEFGPFLIINGKAVKIKGNGGWGIAPRTAIGQRKDGIVLLLVIDGRLPSSIGATMNDLIKIFQQYGAYNAANLDGGSSTELYVKGKIKNTPVGGGKDGLRKMPIYWVVK